MNTAGGASGEPELRQGSGEPSTSVIGVSEVTMGRKHRNEIRVCKYL